MHGFISLKLSLQRVERHERGGLGGASSSCTLWGLKSIITGFKVAALGSNLSPPQTTANCIIFPAGLPPETAQNHGLASEGQQIQNTVG